MLKVIDNYSTGFGRGDCLKYYEAVMTDPVLKVTPLHAFSHMTTKFFFHPMAVAATYLSKFIQEMTGNLRSILLFQFC